LEELEKSLKVNVNVSRELNALESKILDLNNHYMLKKVIMAIVNEEKYGDAWDNSFLKLFNERCLCIKCQTYNFDEI